MVPGRVQSTIFSGGSRVSGEFARQLLALWGTLQGEVYLDGLIVDERGNRQGFPADALRALLVLQRVQFQQYGTCKRVDPWDVASRKK